MQLLHACAYLLACARARVCVCVRARVCVCVCVCLHVPVLACDNMFNGGRKIKKIKTCKNVWTEGGRERGRERERERGRER